MKGDGGIQILVLLATIYLQKSLDGIQHESSKAISTDTHFCLFSKCNFLLLIVAFSGALMVAGRGTKSSKLEL